MLSYDMYVDSHHDTVIVAMTGLSESEVKELLERYLGNTKAVISKELVKNVLKASSGSPFWCATIAKVCIPISYD